MSASIDFADVVARTDLRRLIEADLGPPDRGGRWRCPYHGDHDPALSIAPDGRRWRCWACGASGTALDWTMRREGLGVAEAARRLAGRPPGQRDRRPARPRPTTTTTTTVVTPAPPAPAAHDDPAWQAAVDRIVCRAEAELWSRAGRPALDWLRGRGLADLTIRSFRIGFVPVGVRTDPLPCLAGDDGRPRRISVPRGVTIPWIRPGSWYLTGPEEDGIASPPRWVGCNVRRLTDGLTDPAEGGKYRALLGSARGFPYPHSDPTPGMPALICEGEFDALIGWQEAGWLVAAVTIGGASQGLRPEALATLAAAPAWLLSLDHDPAGDAAFRRWHQHSPRRARRLRLPAGKDLSEFVRDGGDVVGWLDDEFARLGLRRPTRPAR